MILSRRYRNFLKIKFGSWIDNTSFNKDFYIKDTIGIFGPARSGTTWLMELLLNIPEYTSVFEPFHPHWFLETVLNGFAPKPILLNPEYGERFERYLERVFTGKINIWFLLYDLTLDNVIKRLNAHKIIVKAIRANWILPWITQRFDLRSVFFIARHPYAVISSQIKTGYTGYTRDDGSNYFPQKNEIVTALEKLLPEEDEMHKSIC